MQDSYLKTWDALYEKGRQGKYPNEMLIRFINSRLSRDQRATTEVLDLGFGTGRHLVYLAEEGFQAHGIEYSQSGFDIAEKWLAEKNLTAHLTLGSLVNTALESEKYDAIIDIASVQHNAESDIEKIISSVHAALKPGGYYFSLMKNRTDSLFGEGTPVSDMTYSISEGTDKVPNSFILSFLTETRIHALLAAFSSVSIETEQWTYANQTRHVSHWVITAQK